jgi:2-oxoacid:acceptor oxidoreductase delta subunit (pyruvate/2-ketoisovalerate family)
MKGKEFVLESRPAGWANVTAAGLKTGSWRTLRPVVDTDICTGFGTCESYCPENTIYVADPDGKACVDFDYCKGCGVCSNECPFDAIEMRPEAEYVGKGG